MNIFERLKSKLQNNPPNDEPVRGIASVIDENRLIIETVTKLEVKAKALEQQLLKVSMITTWQAMNDEERAELVNFREAFSKAHRAFDIHFMNEFNHSKKQSQRYFPLLWGIGEPTNGGDTQ